jgi:hypothetical protein
MAVLLFLLLFIQRLSAAPKSTSTNGAKKVAIFLERGGFPARFGNELPGGVLPKDTAGTICAQIVKTAAIRYALKR